MTCLMKYKFSLVLAVLTWILISCSSKEGSEIIDLYKASGAEKSFEITYPETNTLFPPEIVPPTIEWNDESEKANAWLAYIEINGAIAAESGYLKKPRWTPDSADWEQIKGRTFDRRAKIKVLGVKRKRGEEVELISAAGDVTIKTSKDSVGAPILYRTVPLPFGFAVDNLETISWRLGDISRKRPKVVLQNMPVCANCHSLTRDGSVLAMDVDYGNDKGSYFVGPTDEVVSLDVEDIITWSDYKREDGELTFGLLSSISPEGRYALSTVKDRSIFVRVDSLAYSQLFFPIKGIIGIYDRKKDEFSSLPGANDPNYCQSNPVWSPDGKDVVFTKSRYYRFPEAERRKDVVLPTRFAKVFLSGKEPYKYSLYRVPFNGGEGGEAVPIEGASHNGKSNYFAKYSPDGKWIVFTRAENFMLLQPDAKLYIMPAEGGESRLMNCNQPGTMNSWHSWSPNGKWLVFSSKARGPYTQLYLTHIDEEGNDTPAVFLKNLLVKNLAANIPEFANIEYGGMDKIIENFMDADKYSFVRGKARFDKGNLKGALEDVNKSIEKEPDNPVYYNMRALIKVEMSDYRGAVKDFTKQIELEPDRFDAYANRAAAYFNLRKFEKAIKDLNKAIELNPKGSRAYYSRGSAKYNLGDYEGAIKDYTKAIELNPKNDRAYFERGIACLQLNQFAKGRKDLKIAEDLGNENAGVYLEKMGLK